MLAVAIASLALAQNLWAWQRVVRPQVDSFTAGMHASLIPWGRWFAEHTASDAVVAAPDIGALGYVSQRRVLDLAGLVTPAMVPILRTMSQEDATARFAFVTFARPDYLVDRAPRAWDLEQRSAWAASLVRIGHATLPNLGIARPAFADQEDERPTEEQGAVPPTSDPDQQDFDLDDDAADYSAAV